MVTTNFDSTPGPALHRFELIGDGARFVLPRRPGAGSIVGGLGCMVPFGLVFAGIPTAMLVGAVWGSGSPIAFRIIFSLMALPFLIAGLFLIVFGLGCAFGHTEVHVTRGRLVHVERLGPLRWSRSRPLDDLKRFVLEAKATETASERSVTDTLRAEFEHTGDLALVYGYPRPAVAALGAALAEYCTEDAGAKLFEREKRTSFVVETDGVVAPEVLDDAPRPAKTDVQVEPRDGGVTITVPPAGAWRGSKGLFGFSLLWCGFMVIFTSVAVGVPLWNGKAPPIPFLAFCALFWAIGIALFIGGLTMGRRHVILDVVGDVLLVTRKSLFGLKQQEWGPDALADIGVGPSGMEVNDVPILELQVHPTSGKTTGLLSQRSDEELRWIASELRRALGRAAGADAESA